MYTHKKSLACAVLLLTIALAMVSCTANKMYSGPELPPDKVAYIKPELGLGFLKPGTIIGSVDGKKPGFNDTLIAVEPGKHTVAVRLHVGKVFGGLLGLALEPSPVTPFKVLSLDAEAGHTYVARGTREDGEVVIWIEDEETKKVVVGKKPE